MTGGNIVQLLWLLGAIFLLIYPPIALVLVFIAVAITFNS